MRNQNDYTEISKKRTDRNHETKGRENMAENQNKVSGTTGGNAMDTIQDWGIGLSSAALWKSAQPNEKDCSDRAARHCDDGGTCLECCGCGGCKNCNCSGRKDCIPNAAPKEASEATYSQQLREAIQNALKGVMNFMIADVSEDLEPDDNVVLLLSEDGDDTVLGRAECEAAYDGVYRFQDEELEEDFGLFVTFDSDHLVQIGEDAWLIDAPLLVFEIDEYGNECDISADTVIHARRFLKERRAELALDGKAYSAFRLSI